MSVENRELKIIALFMIELIILMPVSFAGLTITSLSNPASNITKTSAVITWWTNYNATSELNYSETPALGLNIINDTLSTYHRIVLTGLTPATTYYYKLVSRNASGEFAVKTSSDGSPFQLKTEGTGDTTKPSIKSINLSVPSDSSATISFEASEPVRPTVYYSTSKVYSKKVSGTKFTSKGSLTITGLKAGTYYYYILGLCDNAGNCINSSESKLIAEKDSGTISLNATVPRYSKKRYVNIKGNTLKNTKVKVYVNGEWKRAVITKDGSFVFNNVVMPKLAPESNTVKVEAVSQTGKKASKSFITTIDNVPPVLYVKDIANFTSDPSIKVEGYVNENVTLTITSSGGRAHVPPKVQNLTISRVEKNSIELRWNRVDEKDFKEYVVYRDAVPITKVRTNYFTDAGATVDSGVSYTYQVSAVSIGCSEGPKSDPLTVTTVGGGQKYNKTPQKISICDAHASASKQVSGNFSETVNLNEGNNTIVVTATDPAGNSASKSFDLLMDSKPPQILKTNLDKLSPSYTREVEVTGIVSEPSEIWIWLNNGNNNSPNIKAYTDEDGNFEVSIPLTTEIIKESEKETSTEDPETKTKTYEIPDSWSNKVKIIAVDKVGLKSDPVEEDIEFRVCGKGSWWRVDMQGPMPNILNPRMIVEGQAMVGFAVNLTWAGGGSPGVIKADPRVERRPLSLEEMQDWDAGWVTVQPLWHRNRKTGYLNVKVNAVTPGAGKNWTMYQKEENLSNHRVGECGVPGAGCIKVPLMLTVEFSTDDYEKPMIQRQCWDLMIPIDKRIPPSALPEDLLKKLIELFTKGVELIDTVLKPLQVVMEYSLYGCLVAKAVSGIKTIKEEWACKFSTAVALDPAVFAKRQEIEDVASVGMCSAVYGKASGSSDSELSDDERIKNACKKCEDAKRSVAEFEKEYLTKICDRIFCPAVPSLRKVIRESSLKKIEVNSNNYKKPIYTGSSCAFYKAETKSSSGNELKLKSSKDVDFSFDVFKQIWEDYHEQKNNKDKSGKDAGSEDEVPGCYDALHPASKECCGVEYVEDWDSACLLMDELKKNLCLEKQNYNDAEYKGSTNIKGSDISCGFLDSFDMRMCVSSGIPNAEFVPTRWKVKPECANHNSVEELNNDPSIINGKKLYFRVIPPGKKSGSKYGVDIGYLTKEYGLAEPGKSKIGEPALVQQNLAFIPLSDCGSTDWTSLFEKTDKKNSDINIKKLQSELKKVSESRVSDKAVKSVYKDVQSRMGIRELDYIVDPTSGLITSGQCVCFPAFSGYLKLYRRIMQEAVTCFQTILLTGDGSPGICREFISRYICDLIYDAIKCFSTMYSNPGTSRSFGTKIGNLFGAVTSGFSKAESRARERYGKSSVYASFAEKKLIHSACMFVFTGTWDIDFTAMLEQDMGMPIKSIGLLAPCERRFQGFTYKSTPPGIATWNYHLGAGLIAGSDLDWSLKLKCSNGISCSQDDGFKYGRCDCSGKEETITIRSGRLKKGESLGRSGEIWENIQGARSKKRYDTAILEWRYKDRDGKFAVDNVSCRIKQTGGEPPAYCKFDLSQGIFLCSLFVGEDSFAKFNDDPEILYPDDGKAYKIGNKIRFSYDISQKVSDESCNSMCECEGTKILVYRLKNQNGAVIATNEKKGICLHENGQIEDTVDLVKVQESHFRKEKTSVDIKITGPKNYFGAAVKQSNIVESTSVSPNVDKKTEFEFTIGEDGTCKTETICGTGIVTAKAVEHEGITVKFKNTPKGADPKAEGDFTVKVSYNPKPETASVLDKVTWTLDLFIYDVYKAHGTYVRSPTVSSYNGREQKKSVSIIIERGSSEESKGPRCEQGKAIDRSCFCLSDDDYEKLTGSEKVNCKYDSKTVKYCNSKYECVETEKCKEEEHLSEECACGGSGGEICSEGQICLEEECFDECKNNGVEYIKESENNKVLKTCICGNKKCEFGEYCYEDSGKKECLPECTPNVEADDDCLCVAAGSSIEEVKCEKGQTCKKDSDGNNKCESA